MTRLLAVGSAPSAGAGSVTVHRWTAGGPGLGEVVARLDLPSPTWVLWDETGPGPLLHVACEVDPGRVVTLALAAGGGGSTRLELVGESSTGGAGPCHVAAAPDGGHLVAANYGDGSVGLVALDDDHVVSGLVDVQRHQGSGPRADRQGEPHPHQVVPDPAAGVVTVVDLGADSLTTYRVDAGSLEQVATSTLPPGTGPRQLVRVPWSRDSYVVGELCGDLLHLREERPGEFVLDSAVSCSGSAATNHVAHTHLDARRRLLHVSNRGPDTLTTFDLSVGPPRRVGEVATSAHPRHFGVVDDWLLVGGLTADEVALHPVGPDGLPGPAQVVPVPAPACISPGPRVAGP